jgi:Protein of unknown function (DUF3224)
MSESQIHATGSIEVSSWVPETYDETDGGPSLVRIDVVESFHGDIEGEGRAQMIQTLRADGSASFVGVERVTATVADRRGTFVFQDAGTVSDDGRVGGTWFVVAGSGTGEVAGLRGTGTFTAVLGERAAITLDYWFE